MIKLTFNELGILTETTVDPIRQGDTHHKLVVELTNKSNVNYFARFNFTRPDGEKISNVTLYPSSTDTTKYERDIDASWFFSSYGEATLTAFLIDSTGHQFANGQATFGIERTDFSEETTITHDEYAELLTLLAGKVDKNKTIITAKTESQLGNLELWEEGQVFLILKYGNNERTALLEKQGTRLFELANLSAISSLESWATTTQNEIINIKRGLNTKATIEYVDEQVARYGAHKITKQDGSNFETEEDLTRPQTYYVNGVPHELDPNDYAIVNKYSESGDPQDPNAQPARFSWDGDWTFDYLLNELTQGQQQALNSGITAELVEEISSNKDKIDVINTELAGIETELAEKSSVSVSTSEVEDRPVIKSIKVNGFDYNLGGGETYTAGEGIKIEDTTISVDDSVYRKATEQDLIDNDLQEQITNLTNRGRYLSNWNATTGLPVTEPFTELPYEYRQGDYYIIGTVGETNYKPTGTEYTGQASTTVETIKLAVGDEYVYDGTQWVFQKNAPIDLTNYVDLDSAQTIPGVKTFNQIAFNQINAIGVETDEVQLRKGTSTFLRIQQLLAFPYINNLYELGNPTHLFKNIFTGKISDINGSYSSENTFNVINASDIVNNTLTEEQYALITNGKPTLIKGTLGSYKNIFINGVGSLVENRYMCFAFISQFASGFANGVLRITTNVSPKVIGMNNAGYCYYDNKWQLSIGVINSKAFPTYSKGCLYYNGSALSWKSTGETVEIADTSYTGAFASGNDYKFTNPLTSLTITNFETTANDTLPRWEFTFTAGTGFTLSLPTGIIWKMGSPVFNEGENYTVYIKNGVAYLC